MIGRISAAAALVVLCIGLAPLSATAAEAAPVAPRAPIATDYPGDPIEEAKLVAIEDQRIIEVRKLIETAETEGVSQNKPYRLATAPTPTLILVARDSPYTLDSLTEIAPRTVSRDTDGAYLLSENLVVATGATLSITGNGGLNLRLMSGRDGFVSIVAAGGTLVVDGSPELPVSVTSWDPSTGAPDVDTSDGRSYVRAFGGQVLISDAAFSDLGFWSGVTGGLSLTGTDLLSDSAGATASDDAEADPSASDSTLDGELLPADGGLETLSLEDGTDDYGYSTAVIQGATFSRNAFGLFASNSDEVEVRNCVFENSLVDGLLFHRDVTNSRVRSSQAIGNAQDGFRITRATSSVSLELLTASSNGRNGISLEGGALASGPSATGIPVSVYGNNQVISSTASDNGRYGIEVVGGENLTITSNTVERNVMGIVVSAGATAVAITSNVVEDSVKQGIALRDAGLDATITNNVIAGGDIGIFLRDSGGNIENNEISEVSNHGITLVGATGASTVVSNTVSGAGPTAIDVIRTDGTAVRNNDVADWQSTKPLLVVLRSIFQPLTVMWILIGVVILFSAISRARRERGLRNPYADHASLSTLTRGVVARHELGRS